MTHTQVQNTPKLWQITPRWHLASWSGCMTHTQLGYVTS